ncbi:hypothetical protein HDU96_005296 [Phlyctochytrium bullatum]|nr:hypothetical protein HDU96_005296 [Phlyctochytrium bullatum]
MPTTPAEPDDKNDASSRPELPDPTDDLEKNEYATGRSAPPQKFKIPDAGVVWKVAKLQGTLVMLSGIAVAFGSQVLWGLVLVLNAISRATPRLDPAFVAYYSVLLYTIVDGIPVRMFFTIHSKSADKIKERAAKAFSERRCWPPQEKFGWSDYKVLLKIGHDLRQELFLFRQWYLSIVQTPIKMARFVTPYSSQSVLYWSVCAYGVLLDRLAPRLNSWIWTYIEKLRSRRRQVVPSDIDTSGSTTQPSSLKDKALRSGPLPPVRDAVKNTSSAIREAHRLSYAANSVEQAFSNYASTLAALALVLLPDPSDGGRTSVVFAAVGTWEGRKVHGEIEGLRWQEKATVAGFVLGAELVMETVMLVIESGWGATLVSAPWSFLGAGTIFHNVVFGGLAAFAAANGFFRLSE